MEFEKDIERFQKDRKGAVVIELVVVSGVDQIEARLEEISRNSAKPSGVVTVPHGAVSREVQPDGRIKSTLVSRWGAGWVDGIDTNEFIDDPTLSSRIMVKSPGLELQRIAIVHCADETYDYRDAFKRIDAMFTLIPGK